VKRNKDYNILIVAADGNFRSQMSIMLNKYDYSTHPASCGTHGLQLSEELQMDVVIITKNVADLTAIETIGLLRANTMGAKSSTSPQVPIIYLTPSFTDYEVAATTEYNVNGYLLHNQNNIATIPNLIKEMLTK